MKAFWLLKETKHFSGSFSLVVSLEDPSQVCQIDVVSNMFTALTCFHNIDWGRSHQPFLVFHTGCSIGPHRTRQTSVAWQCPPGFHPSSSCKGAEKSDSKKNTTLTTNSNSRQDIHGHTTWSQHTTAVALSLKVKHIKHVLFTPEELSSITSHQPWRR